MNDISNTIYGYYLQNFDDLSFEKQFHFASRLYLFSRDKPAAKLLLRLKPEFTNNGNVEQLIADLIARSRQNPDHGSKNAGALRRPFFEKYPDLKTYVMVLFRLTFLYTVYGIDKRELFLQNFPGDEVERFMARLSEDREAIAVLSTHAINFLYLYELLVKQDDNGLQPERFLEIGQTYDVRDPVQLQLLIYLYTHCIIGESLFYYRKITARLKAYQKMLEELERLLAENFDNVNLDNKFEFLVAAKMLGGRSVLEQQIWSEAEKSFSSEGSFIVDKLNNNPQTDNSSFDKSEHRNVLCVLAGRDFMPPA